MLDKDIKAIGKIINGVLYGTRWFNPMVETMSRYLENKKFINNKVDFKSLCVNGSKSVESDDTLVVYRPSEEKPGNRVFIDNNAGKYNNKAFRDAISDLKEAKGKMLKLVTKTYGYKRKNKSNKR